MKDYYKTLGVSQDASESDLKKAFRSLSLKYHPDRNSNDDAKGIFQEINEAYETLGDPELRNKYDTELKFGEGTMNFQHMNSMDEFNDINNIFNMMFSGMGGMGGIHKMGFGGAPEIRIFNNGTGNFHAQFSHNIQRPPSPITANIEITLEQAYIGCSIPLEYEFWTLSNNMKISEIKTVNIVIPAGVDEDETLVLKGGGNVINENVKGDLYIKINITNKTMFKRQGLDLIIQKQISLKQALCGFSFDILHLNGKVFCLNNSNNSNIITPGFKKIIPTLGMKRDNAVGNLIIVFEIEFPTKLDEQQILSLKEILE